MAAGQGVEDGAIFGRIAGTLPVAAIVKDEAVEAEVVEEVKSVEAMADVAGVAVAEEDGCFGVVGGDVPSGKGLAVGGGDAQVFEGQAEVGGSHFDLSPRHIEQFGLEDEQQQTQPQVHCRNHAENKSYRCHGGAFPEPAPDEPGREYRNQKP